MRQTQVTPGSDDAAAVSSSPWNRRSGAVSSHQPLRTGDSGTWAPRTLKSPLGPMTVFSVAGSDLVATVRRLEIGMVCAATARD
jgi:hypothetical protein